MDCEGYLFDKRNGSFISNTTEILMEYQKQLGMVGSMLKEMRFSMQTPPVARTVTLLTAVCPLVHVLIGIQVQQF